MELKRFSSGLLVALVLFACFGCVSGGTSHFSQPLTSSLSNYKSVAVAVTSNVADTEALVMQIEGAILAALKDQGKYSKVSSAISTGTSSTELKVAVTITELNAVDTFSRVMLGGFAGQGKVYAEIELIETMSGKILAKGWVEGKTSGGSIFAGTTPQAAERVAEEVVKLISSSIDS